MILTMFSTIVVTTFMNSETIHNFYVNSSESQKRKRNTHWFGLLNYLLQSWQKMSDFSSSFRYANDKMEDFVTKIWWTKRSAYIGHAISPNQIQEMCHFTRLSNQWWQEIGCVLKHILMILCIPFLTCSKDK